MIRHEETRDASLRSALRRGALRFAGHEGRRVYGRLDCAAGRRMLRKNRVFFADEAEAIEAGFRPCGCCMRDACRSHVASDGRRTGTPRSDRV